MPVPQVTTVPRLEPRTAPTHPNTRSAPQVIIVPWAARHIPRAKPVTTLSPRVPPRRLTAISVPLVTTVLVAPTCRTRLIPLIAVGLTPVQLDTTVLLVPPLLTLPSAAEASTVPRALSPSWLVRWEHTNPPQVKLRVLRALSEVTATAPTLRLTHRAPRATTASQAQSMAISTLAPLEPTVLAPGSSNRSTARTALTATSASIRAALHRPQRSSNATTVTELTHTPLLTLSCALNVVTARKVLTLPSFALTDIGPLGLALAPKTTALPANVESGANSLPCLSPQSSKLGWLILSTVPLSGLCQTWQQSRTGHTATLTIPMTS